MSFNLGQSQLKNDTLLNLIFENLNKSTYDEYINKLTSNFYNEKDEIKIFYLIVNFYKRIPHDLEISTLFNISINKSKELISKTITLYKIELKDFLEFSLINILKHHNNTALILKTEALKIELNNILIKINEKLNLLEKKEDSMHTYYLDNKSIFALLKNFDI